jgi:hypothetical protein
MTLADYERLLIEARVVLERYMFDRVDLRDDVADLCLKIDNALPPSANSNRPRALKGIVRTI